MDLQSSQQPCPHPILGSPPDDDEPDLSLLLRLFADGIDSRFDSLTLKIQKIKAALNIR